MIRLDVQEYCHQCMDFHADVDTPQKAYGLNFDGGEIEISLSDTVVRCTNRRRCEAIKRYLDRQKESASNAETD